MKQYRVTFSYVVNVDADNEDEAREQAMCEFIDSGSYVYSDIEVEEYGGEEIYG